MSGYGITGMGYPLGNIGLGTIGLYGSYDAYMPSNLGMYGNPLGYGNSLFMNNMYQQMQQQMELSQLTHAGRMHAGMKSNEVEAHGNTDSAIISIILKNSDVQQGITNLHKKVTEGDQNGICQTFDELRNYIMNTYRDELAARGDKINPWTSTNEIIERAYATIISAKQGGVSANLRQDIENYGDNAFQNGFFQGFKKGHHDKYIDETMMHCFGLRVDQKESKDTRQTIGKWVGSGAKVLEYGAYGAVAGAGLSVVGTGLAKGVSSVLPSKVSSALKIKDIPFMNTKGWWKRTGKASLIAALLACGYAIYDTFWQVPDRA